LKKAARRAAFYVYFSSLEYPLPYWTQRLTRLRVAEEISDWAMTWL
jgi:hypothetical protein